MESREKEMQGIICNERNVKGKNYFQKVREVGDERAHDPF
jgi:hypothetical protein